MKRISLLIVLASLCNGCGKSGDAVSHAESGQPAAVTASAASTQPQAEQPQVNYSHLLETAEEHVQKRDYTSAVRVLTQAISAHPGQPDAYVRRAALLAEAKQLPLAIKDLSSAIHLDPQSHKLRNTRGYFHLLLKQYEQAEKDFNAAIDRNREYPQAFNNRGLVFIALEKQVAAMNDFKLAIDLKPDYIDAHNNLGFVLMQLDEIDKAIESFTAAIKLDESYLNAWSNRGRAYLKQQRHEEAIADFTRAIEIQPDGLQYYLHRSEAYKSAGQEDQALEDLQFVAWSRELRLYNQRLAQSPKNADLWVARGQHLLAGDRRDEALESFNMAIKVNANHAPAYLARASLSVQRGEYQRAVEDCTKIIETRPLHEAYSVRGDAYFEQGRFDEAISDYESMRRFDSRVVEAYRRRGEQHRTSGDESLATADLEHALVLEKQLTEKVAREATAPREMVIERTAFETDASTKEPK